MGKSQHTLQQAAGFFTFHHRSFFKRKYLVRHLLSRDQLPGMPLFHRFQYPQVLRSINIKQD